MLLLMRQDSGDLLIHSFYVVEDAEDIVMTRRLIVLSWIAACAALPCRTTNGISSPLFNTTAGPVSGIDEGRVCVFRGIPYGADTSVTRFRPPKPPRPWTETKVCTAFGKIAPQPHNISIPGREQSEDCLNLNLYIPILDESPKPVLVWLHPGGYDSGTSNDQAYDGRDLAMRRNAVVVTVNHRLGGFGYLYLGGLDKKYLQGNAGQLDIILALRWVRDNIAAVGGDPKTITLFGQSGGGAKIATLMAMPAAKGLFSRVWTMSGQQVTGRTLEHAKETAQSVVEKFEDGTIQNSVKRLDTMAMKDLRWAFSGPGYRWTPVVDDQTLLQDPFHPEASQLSRDIPIVMGNTYDETRNLIGGSKPELFNLSWDQVPEQLELNARRFLGNLSTSDIVAKYRKHYANYSPSDVFFAVTTAARSWRSFIIQADACARQNGSTPLYVYYFNWKSPHEKGKWGASHGFDIPFVFASPENSNFTRGYANALELSEILSTALVYLARDGRPQLPRNEAIVDWPVYKTKDRKSLVIRNTGVLLQADDRGWERRLFENVPYVQPGT